jgi:hypothetical protein
MARTFLLALLFAVASSACVSAGDEPETEHDEPADFEVDPADGKADGLPATFNQHNVVTDELFLDSGSMTVEEVQTFLEDSPYGSRSWLADYTAADGTSAAQALVNAATAKGISPLMLLARMQVESALVSKTSTPSTTKINRIMGCGCHDGAACLSQFRGFEKQLVCAADTLRKWYDASVDGTGDWRRGKTSRTLDPKSVTPVNHATASLYQYTPWVLVGRGGNWLVWNVSRKYVRYALDEGFIESN